MGAVKQVHRSTHALGTARLITEHLGQQAMQSATECEKVGVRAMRPEDTITLNDVRCDGDCRGLLTDDKVARAFDDGFAEFVTDFFLGAANFNEFTQPSY